MAFFITYLLQASAGIVMLFLVYWLFLKNETFHNANRWFLMAALFVSVLLPVFPIHYSVVIEQGNATNQFDTITDTFKRLPALNDNQTKIETFDRNQVIMLGYIIGATFVLLRLLIQTFLLIHCIFKHNIKRDKGVRILENEKYYFPFSFFNIVFINPKIHKQENLPEILAHEKVHIHDNHWFDLLFIELLTVIFWFNPFIWFFERSIKQNHEYLADKGVLAQGHHSGRYKALLINQFMGTQIIGVTNNLNFALNVNRLKMMTKTKTSRIAGIKFMWALPALVLLLYAFAEPVYKANTFSSDNIVIDIQKSDTVLVITGKVVEDKSGKPLHGASVIIQGSTRGTVTDENGNFILNVPDPFTDTGELSTVLAISFVGRETQLVDVSSVENEFQINVPDIKMKDGIIVINQKLLNLPPPPPPPVNQEKNTQAPPNPPANKQEEIFIVVEELPKYPGGFYSMGEYIREKQNELAKQKKLAGNSKIAFTVSESGKVTDVKIVEQDNEEIGKAAASIVMRMNDWEPGKQRGKPVAVKYLLPVEFN